MQVMSDGAWTADSTVEPLLDDIEDWRELELPDAGDVDWESVSKADLEFFKPDRENYVIEMIHNKGIFERMHFLMGFEDTLCALMTDTEEVAEFAEALCDKKLGFIDKMLEYYQPDVMTFMDDYAFKDNLFMPIDIWREVFKPQLVRVVDCIHSHGVLAKLHCCGKMQDLTEEYLSIGADAIDPVQPLNDINGMFERIKANGKMGICGGLDVQNVVDVEGVSEERIRTEVRRCLDSYSGNPYMIYGASISVRDLSAYAPGKPLGIVIDEYNRYVQELQQLVA